MKTVSVALLIAIIGTSWAWGAEQPTVSLSPPDQSIKRGTAPKFIVTIRAGSEALRVINFPVRGDLRDNYARLIVTRGGTTVNDMPIVISDPGPISESDYISLEPGQALSFVHDGSPQVLTELPAGTYQAFARVQPGRLLGAIQTSPVSFMVSEQ